MTKMIPKETRITDLLNFVTSDEDETDRNNNVYDIIDDICDDSYNKTVTANC